MSDFLKGAAVGFLFALCLSGWWLMGEGIGVSGSQYVWPFQLFTTNVWVTGDIFMTMVAVLAGVGAYLGARSK